MKNKEKSKCKVDSCDNIEHALGYCIKHYKQYTRHGCILNRTRFDPNEIIYFDDHAEIFIYDKYNNPKDKRIFIDLDDVEKVKNLKWSIDSKGYPVTTINKTQKIRMHRYILNLEEDIPVDHKNKNRMDNRKNNLRIATNSDNNANKSKQRNNTSGFTGVYFIRNRWQVFIQYYKKEYNLGSYSSKDIAISVRLQGEKIIFKEFAPNINKFDLILNELKDSDTIEDLVFKARKLDMKIHKPLVNKLDKKAIELLYNDIEKDTYTRDELALKYQCSLPTIDRYKRNYKIIKNKGELLYG